MTSFTVCHITEAGLSFIRAQLALYMRHRPPEKCEHYFAAVAEQNQELYNTCQFEIRASETWHHRPQVVTLAPAHFRIFELHEPE